jgi:serine/threonine protein kinase
MSLCINPNCSKPYNNPDNHLFCQACGSELLLAGRYRVTRLLSDKGGFGNTYEAIDKGTLKVLKVLTNNNQKAIELFQQEARVLKKLNHPGIPKGESNFTYFPRDRQTPIYCLVMEKIEGMDLEEYQQQRKNKPIDQKLALEWLSQLTNILHEVHRHKFFHRDIKPSNIILKPDGKLALIDFGASRKVTKTIMAGGQNTGIYTPGYAPPEQEKGYAVQQSDFFALGRTFIYLLTGKEPTDSEIYDHYNNELKWRDRATQIAPQLGDFIDELIADKANERPANTSILLQRIEKIKNELYPLKISSKLKKQPALPSTINAASDILPKYAGFWLRFKASFIDAVIVTILAAFVGGMIGFRLPDIQFLVNFSIYFPNYQNSEQQAWMWALATVLGTNIWIFLFFIIFISGVYIFDREIFWGQFHDHLLKQFHNPSFLAFSVALSLGFFLRWFYFVFLESSCLRATLGKYFCQLKVTDLDEKGISLKKANKRYWAKLLSIATLYIGFMISGWTKKKRALHDIIAGTLVIRRK